jgi:hypothetical protein
MWKSGVLCRISKQRGKVQLPARIFSTLRHFHSAPQAIWEIGPTACSPGVALGT